MKKIMFNNHFGLHDAVKNRRKERTFRSCAALNHPLVTKISDWHTDCSGRCYVTITYSTGVEGDVYPAYQLGEEVAVAQSYESIYNEDPDNDYGNYYLKQFRYAPGWTNKMFVRPEFMPERIRITGVKVVRLQDVSDIDCLHEGVYFYNCGTDSGFKVHGIRGTFSSAIAAFAALIDKLSGKGSWDKNPWGFAYYFELIKTN